MIKSSTQITTSLVLLAAIGSSMVSCQFLQPQSHLGRLVQSITSPLVLSGYGREAGEADESPSSGYPSDQQSGSQTGPASAQYYQNHQQQQQQQRYQQQAALQQAPSQQRGVPQQYYGGQDEDGGAPSNNRYNSNKQPEYQMGAYLGPTIDDKEIQGAFNSNNDDRDDDDGPMGYDESPNGGKQRAASNSYAGGSDGYGDPSSAAQYNARPSGYGSPFNGPSDDDSNADEDEGNSAGPTDSARGARGRSQPKFRSMSQAASQYQQRQQSASGPRANGPNTQMMAAANGYAPYGYASGPVDLAGLIGAANGDPNSGYQVYQGDGSYPPAGYYQQQGNGNGRRKQSASMNNGYYNNGYNNNNGPYNNNANSQANNGDNEDRDSDDNDD